MVSACFGCPIGRAQALRCTLDPATDDRGPSAECDEFADRYRPVHRRHPAVRAGIQSFQWNKARRPLDRFRDFLRRLDAVAGDIDRPEQDFLVLQKAKQVERNLGSGAFDRDLIDPALGEGREDRLVLTPFRPKARLQSIFALMP